MSATRAVSVSVNGMVLDRWTSVAINRDLGEICGSFELTLRDDARSLAAWPYGTPGQIGLLLLSQPVEISVYGQVVLRGWVEAVEQSYQEGEASLTIAAVTLPVIWSIARPGPRVRWSSRACAWRSLPSGCVRHSVSAFAVTWTRASRSKKSAWTLQRRCSLPSRNMRGSVRCW
ncbi:hypothetical protein V6L77_00580 [Pannonibacter sp. Pt2-lr]